MSMDTAKAAAWLRELADALDTAPDPVPIRAYVSFSARSYGPDRIAQVDAVAALLGLTAAPTRTGGTGWYHEASVDTNDTRLRVFTRTGPPFQVCACGAVCTHEG